MNDPVSPVPKISRLTFLKDLGMRPVGKGKKRYAIYRCECGTEKEIMVCHVKSGRIKSCGCLSRETALQKLQSINAKKHGLSKHPLYKVWYDVVQRCYNPKHKSYQIYGGSGIKVCTEWRNDPASFINWALSEGWQPNKDVHRILGAPEYKPRSCEIMSRTDHRSIHRSIKNQLNRIVRISEKISDRDEHKSEWYEYPYDREV
jgi:hypothetical protein